MIPQLIADLKGSLNKYPKQQSRDEVIIKYLNLQKEYYHGRKIIDLSGLNLLEDCFHDIISKDIAAEFEELLIFFANIFKFNNKFDTINEIVFYLPESAYKLRLQAFVLHRRLDDIKTDLITIADEYFELMNNADLLSEEDISIDLINDIYQYYHFGIEKLKSREYLLELSEFKQIFSTTYTNKCSLLLHPYFLELLHTERSNILLEIDEEVTELYQPSQFIDRYFAETILQPIRELPKTQLPSTILGFPKDAIRKDIIEYGLTDFDLDYDVEVTADIKVLLYSYFNLRKHYFSMYHIFRKINMDQILPTNNILFVDIGSGPGTSGLVVSDYVNNLKQQNPFSYLGIDISERMNQVALRNLTKCTKNQKGVDISFGKALRNSLVKANLKHSNFIVFVASYLFASKSLDEREMARLFNEILEEFKHMPVMLVYQNPESIEKNVKFNNFKQGVPALKSVYLATETIFYKNRRKATNDPSRETVCYEVLGNNLVKLKSNIS